MLLQINFKICCIYHICQFNRAKISVTIKILRFLLPKPNRKNGWRHSALGHESHLLPPIHPACLYGGPSAHQKRLRLPLRQRQHQLLSELQKRKPLQVPGTTNNFETARTRFRPFLDAPVRMGHDVDPVQPQTGHFGQRESHELGFHAQYAQIGRYHDRPREAKGSGRLLQSKDLKVFAERVRLGYFRRRKCIGTNTRTIRVGCTPWITSRWRITASSVPEIPRRKDQIRKWTFQVVMLVCYFRAYLKSPQYYVRYKDPAVLPLTLERSYRSPYLPERALAGRFSPSSDISYKRWVCLFYLFLNKKIEHEQSSDLIADKGI